MRLAACLAWTVVAAALGLSPALAERRVALVIGNSAYRHMPRLSSPGRDARDMAAALTRLGFQTTTILDADRLALNDGFKRFSQSSAGADMVFVYYSGHGTQLDGRNWLLPIDAKLDTRDDVNDADLLALDRVTAALRDKAAVRIVVLDACRDNPMANALNLKLAEAQGFKNAPLTKGLARAITAAGDLVVYATQAGAVAADGGGATSPFTTSLLKHIETPDIDVRNMFFKVQTDVARTTRQVPEVSNSVIGEEFKLRTAALPARPAQTRPAAAPEPDPAERAWAVIQNTTSMAVLETFIAQYGETFYGSAARARLEELKKAQAAATVPAGPGGADTPAAGGGLLSGLADWLRKPAPPETAAKPVIGTVGPAPPFTPLPPERERGLKPKDSFKECDTCPEMVVVPAGSFTMGSPETEKDRGKNEGPQHVVTFERPFAVGKFEVTVDQFAAFVKASGRDAGSKCSIFENGKDEKRSDISWRNPGYPQSGSHPAACLTWRDALAYVEWLAQTTERQYRLLSEAEWEYAARGRTLPGNAPRFHFGDDEQAMCRYGNGPDQTTKGKVTSPKKQTLLSCTDGYVYAAPVGRFVENPFGLHDMHGNVWEWTADCIGDYESYDGAPSDGSARTWGGGALGDCGFRVLRGGSWNMDASHLRAAMRGKTVSDDRVNFVGVRVARTLTPPASGSSPTVVAAVAPPVAPAAPPEAAAKPVVGTYAPESQIKVTPLPPARERSLKPKDTFKECDQCPEMVAVPAGSFTMGSPASEKGRFVDDESPQHKVTFKRPFAVGKFSVTFAQWDACAADGGCDGYRPLDEGWGRGKQPVIGVSWPDAKAYVAWLSRKTGKTYRLLSEAEREYVTRAGTTTPFWWGSSISPSQANYDGDQTNDNGPKGENRKRPLPVDSFKPNPFGLYQVHGNVAEWTEDCYHGSYNDAPTDGSARTSGNCRERVTRGGAWKGVPGWVRAAARFPAPADAIANPVLRGHNFIGFRVARTLSP